MTPVPTKTFELDENEVETIKRSCVATIHQLRSDIRDWTQHDETDDENINIIESTTELRRVEAAYMSISNNERHMHESYPTESVSTIRCSHIGRVEIVIELRSDASFNITLNATPDVRKALRDRVAGAFMKVDFRDWLRMAIDGYSEVKFA